MNDQTPRRSFENLIEQATDESGSIDLAKMEEIGEKLDLGENGGVKCDVDDGPCACGAWHFRHKKN